MKTSITKRDWQSALDVQSACNLSGVIFSFAKVMQRLCDDIPDTKARNEHPICVLYAAQITFLTGNGIDNPHVYNDAYEAAEKAVEEHA